MRRALWKKQSGFSNLVGLIIIAVLIILIVLVLIISAAIVGSHTSSVGATKPMVTTTTSGGGTPGTNKPPATGNGACTFDTVSDDAPGSNLTSVNVPIWKYTGSGSKTSGTKSLRVHRNCAAAITEIFNTIYKSQDKPPINTSDTGCYSARSRSTSRHNWGVACDINWNENWCHNCYGRSGSNVGNFWKPGDITPDRTYSGWSSGYDARSISINGTVANAFSAKGWGRGLYRSFNDFMHFSVDGH